jgi:hypothetical protein
LNIKSWISKLKNAGKEILMGYLQFFVVALLAIVVKLFPANVKGSLM